MNIKIKISAGIVAVIAILLMVTPFVSQLGFDTPVTFTRQGTVSLSPQQFSYEKAEESWSCEYMMELPGMCIMRV